MDIPCNVNQNIQKKPTEKAIENTNDINVNEKNLNSFFPSLPNIY